MKQTAVEWLIEQWPILESQIPERILTEAKEMEKEQIIDAVDCCFASLKLSDDKTMFVAMTAEQYYNETFKSE